ncbi:hypothetical protein PVA17_08015 [Lysinibacillus sp. CNPSo 3705]|uniref:hypothetical protein n=1 Tax=Lysinibacillus sp. CNPSo 3705 TaxID=3028148 RepID=UPI0023631BC6|nr:hypothetical protein [Lysinibacillus sp. CNPSo 3705]MDD1502711.1 hypothetical protein [Lysinibacillus sp. CNPSo 3705]
METGRLLGDQRFRGTEAKSITSCDNASVQHRVGPRPYSEAKRLIERPQEALLCAKAKRQQQMFSVAKAKQQLQSAQLERKSTSRFAKKPFTLFNMTHNFIHIPLIFSVT